MSLVSVIMPVYNAECYLAEAIESVLAQDYAPIELMIVDDGSTDQSADIAQTFAAKFGDRIRYLYQNNAGIGAARNRGIQLSKGDFFGFLDADDYWVSNKLRLQVTAFRSNPILDIVFGQVQQFFSPELSEAIRQTIRCSNDALTGHIPGAMLVKRSAFDAIGLFPTQRKLGEFMDWYLRATEFGLHQECLSDVVLWRRIHQMNHGIQHRSSFRDYAHILKASLDRRRHLSRQENRTDG